MQQYASGRGLQQYSNQEGFAAISKWEGFAAVCKWERFVARGWEGFTTICNERGLLQLASEASNGQMTNFSSGKIVQGGMAIVSEQSERWTDVTFQQLQWDR